jgi:vacuolar protein sorting-associated protein 13A/C
VKKNPTQDKSLMPGDDFIPEPKVAIHISSGDTMNITISKSCLNVFNNLAKVCLILLWNISSEI